MSTITRIYVMKHGRKLYWNTCGWTDRRANARRYQTEAEAERPLRRIMIENVWKPKVETATR